GSKLCNQDGNSFQPCQCGEDNGSPVTGGDEDGGTLPTDAGFEPVDSGPQRDAGIPPIDGRCAGKLVVLAGNDKDLDAIAGIYKGGGAFDLAVSHGPALRSNATIVDVAGSLVAVYLSRFSLIVGAKYSASWSAPTSIGNATTDARPSLVSTGTQ